MLNISLQVVEHHFGIHIPHTGYLFGYDKHYYLPCGSQHYTKYKGLLRSALKIKPAKLGTFAQEKI